MEWKTSISHIKDGQEIIRGYNLGDLIANVSFVETIYLILRGKLPNKNEITMLNALFTSAIDHGVGVSSAITARTVISTGNSMHTAIAAGILAMGKLHGSAIEGSAKFLQDNINNDDLKTLVVKCKKEHVRIPGYGHKILKDDHRASVVFRVAKKNNFYKEHCKLAEKIYTELNKTSSKHLPLNIDGAMGAIISDMGFDWRMAKGFFIIGRVPGLVAHTYEELIGSGGLRRLSEDDVEYTGEENKNL